MQVLTNITPNWRKIRSVTIPQDWVDGKDETRKTSPGYEEAGNGVPSWKEGEEKN